MTFVRGVAALLIFAVAVFARAVAGLSPFPLTGTVWAWHASTHVDGARAAIAAPERYTIELLPDGVVRVLADCNRGGGRYQANDVEISFGPIAATKVGCPAGSRGGEFLAGLSRVASYRFEGIELVLSSADGQRTMRFKPATR